MGRHLPYGITQCYLPPDTSECAPSQLERLVLDIPTPDGWKAELTWWLVIYRDGVPAGSQSPMQVLITGPGAE